MAAKTGLTRTKGAIVAALLGLMETEPFAEITVTQIVQRAEVARRTFYLNYATKEDVMRDCIAAQAQEYIARLGADAQRDLAGDVQGFFDYWAGHAKLLRLLYDNDLFGLLLDAYEQILQASDAFPYLGVPSAGDDLRARYTKIMAATILWRVQLEWVRTGMAETTSDLAAITLDLVPASVLEGR